MIAINQRSNEPVPKKAPSCYRRKSYKMIVLFVLWLIYTACALGWFILETPSSVQCINHVN